MATPYTFGDLKSEVKTSIWPNDPPENLVTAIDRMLLQAVNWIQQNVECLKDEHLDITHQCDTIFHCGLTVIDRPDGQINKLFTVQHSGFCDPVTYVETDKNDLLSWSRWFMKSSPFWSPWLGSNIQQPANSGLPALPAGFTQAASSTNDPWGRALFGLWAKDKDRLLIAPWLQSYEDVVVEWEGYKSKWDDTDVVPSSPDYVRAIKLFVQREFARDFERDPGFQQVCGDDLQGNPARNIIGAIPSLIFQCNQKIRQMKSQHSPIETDYLWLNYQQPVDPDPDTGDEIVIAAIGDYGLDGAAQTSVATLVKSWNPVQIITSGNNNYPSGAAATIDANVGKNWFSFITPYRGIYGAESGVNRFWPSLGQVDLDTSTGQPYKDYFTLPNNERYYDKVIGPVHFFFINSGYNSVGTMTETDGNTEASDQANYILMRAIRSTIKWKGAIFNSPQLSSQSGIGKSAMGWDWGKYGFDFVINAGNSQSYERIMVNGIPVFVNGSGGSGLRPFTGTPVDGSAVRFDSNYGALQIAATCDKLTLQFIDIAGNVQDSYELT